MYKCYFCKSAWLFSSRLLRTLEEVVDILLTSDLSFFQNLPVGDMMEMAYEITHNMFKGSSLFSLIFVAWGDVLAPSSPFNARC